MAPIQAVQPIHCPSSPAIDANQSPNWRFCFHILDKTASCYWPQYLQGKVIPADCNMAVPFSVVTRIVLRQISWTSRYRCSSPVRIQIRTSLSNLDYKLLLFHIANLFNRRNGIKREFRGQQPKRKILAYRKAQGFFSLKIGEIEGMYKKLTMMVRYALGMEDGEQGEGFSFEDPPWIFVSAVTGVISKRPERC